MTDPPRKHRKRRIAPLLLFLILGIAAWLRLRGVGFGLPALNDPDEPLFMMTAFDMLRNKTFNPGWFGHPGTVTLYCLALVCLGVGILGSATGRFAGADGFAQAVYADPGIVFLPARLFIVACALVCILLTYRLGKRLGGERTGLIAAGALAINAVHIDYSLVIRTDMQASIFVLLAASSALSILHGGRERDYVLAGLWVGLATATKWPAAMIAIAPLCAGLARLWQGRREIDLVVLFAISAVVSLFLASPYLLLDYPAVLRDLAGEARALHPGATGGGFLANLGWYLAGPLRAGFGLPGLVLALTGLVLSARADLRWAVTVAMPTLLFLGVIATQNLVWERWIIPVLPLLSLALAWSVCTLFDQARVRWRTVPRGVPFLSLATLLAVITLPMLGTEHARATERANDTRQMASRWLLAHAAPGSPVLVEDAAIDLMQAGHPLLFPLGSAGCIDARAALAGQIEYDEVEDKRAASPIIDIGHVAPERIASCRTADYAVITHAARYRQAPEAFAGALQRYRSVLDGAVREVCFTPRPGVSGGPKTCIYRLPATPAA